MKKASMEDRGASVGAFCCGQLEMRGAWEYLHFIFCRAIRTEMDVMIL